MPFESLIFIAPWWWILLWEAFLVLMFGITWRLIGIKRLNTFSLFLPLALVTNGIFQPFARNINQVISGIDIGEAAYLRCCVGLALFYVGLPAGILLANSSFRAPVRFRIVKAQCRWPVGCVLFLLLICFASSAYLWIIKEDGMFLNPVVFVRGFGDAESYAQYRYTFAEMTSGAKYF